MKKTWAESHVASDTRGRDLSFGALLPNLQASDGTSIALIRRGTTEVWASLSDLLLEIKKTYPEAELIKYNTHQNGTSVEHDAIKFSEPSASKFAGDFIAWMDKNRKPAQIC